MKTNGVPKIRFKGFTDDWEQRKLTEIVNRVNKSSNSDVLPKVEFEDIVSGEGRLNKDISSKFDSRKGTLFEPENILYGKLRPYLKNWLFSDFEGVALGDFWVFEATDVSVPSFDYYLIQSDNYQKVANDTSGTKMPRSDWKNVSSTDFAIPSKDEQKQIGAFFKQLDNTIVLHQRKCEQTKELKKFMLQKMFPKKGEKNPEIRFPGFTDAWEQRELGEIAARVQGNDGRMDIPTLTISAANGWMNQKERFSGNIAGKEQKNYTLLHKGELSYNHGNSKLAKYGAVFSLETYKEALVPRVYHSFKVIDGNPKFIEYYFATKIPDRELAKLVSSGARMDGLLNINFNEFMGINLTVPNKSEQEKISNYFSNLDHLITLHQRKCEQLKELKKFMLQNMFPKKG